MEKETFINVSEPWWLIEQDLDPPALNELRDRLADDLGWDRSSWYSDQNKVLDLYNLIESHEPRLLMELDEATDEHRREEWLVALTELAAPGSGADDSGEAAEHETEEAAGGRAGVATGEDSGTWDDNWQMLYRQGPDGAYLYAYSDDQSTVRPGAQWMSHEEAMQAKGADGAQREAATAALSDQAEPATGVAPQAESQEVHAWSADYGPDGQGMFYRQSDDGSYEFAFSSTGAEKGHPVEPWIADPKLAVEATVNLQIIVDSPIDVDQETAARLASDPSFSEELQQVPAAEDLAAWSEEVEVDWTEMDEEVDAAEL